MSCSSEPNSPSTAALHNREQYIQEIEVLQSVLPENDFLRLDEEAIEVLVPIHKTDGSPSSHISLLMEPQDTPESSSSSSSSGKEASASASSPSTAAFTIAHLPPLSLQVIFHDEYPSTEPPMFTLSCSWLSTSQLSQLCAQLDNIWYQSPHEVVVWNWIFWLQENAWDMVKLKDNTLDLAQLSTEAQNLFFGNLSMSPEPSPDAEGCCSPDCSSNADECSTSHASSSSPSAASSSSTPIKKTPPNSLRSRSPIRTPPKSPILGSRSPILGKSECSPSAVVEGAAAALESEEIDSRAFSDCLDIKSALASILQHDRKQRRIEFEREEQTCQICFCDAPGSDFFYREQCFHGFCKDCSSHYVDGLITEGSVLTISCPIPSCRQILHPHEIRGLVSPEQYERYERLLLQKTLDTMGLTECPRCSDPVLLSEKDFGVCPTCNFAICGKCHFAYHGGDCAKYGLMGQMNAIGMKLSASDAAGARGEERRRQLQLRMDEVKNLHLLHATTKPCPSCGMAIEKNGGCSKVICSNCSKAMCFRCGSKIEGYDHFTAGRCELFPVEGAPLGVAANRANIRLGAQLQRAQLQMLQPNRNLRFACAHCRTETAKIDNNNHVICQVCRRSSCFLCKGKVYSTRSHFFPAGKCRQHSND